MNFFKKMKSRWGIQSNWQLFIIMVVFALTGISALYSRRFLFPLLGIESQDPFWFKTLIWAVTIFPMYNIFILVYGAMFGQFDFFWGRLKKMYERMGPDK